MRSQIPENESSVIYYIYHSVCRFHKVGSITNSHLLYNPQLIWPFFLYNQQEFDWAKPPLGFPDTIQKYSNQHYSKIFKFDFRNNNNMGWQIHWKLNQDQTRIFIEKTYQDHSNSCIWLIDSVKNTPLWNIHKLHPRLTINPKEHPVVTKPWPGVWVSGENTSKINLICFPKIVMGGIN